CVCGVVIGVLSGSYASQLRTLTGLGSDCQQWRDRSGISPDSSIRLLHRGSYTRGLLAGAVTQLLSGVLGGVGDRDGLHGGAVGADFGPDIAEFGGVETHSDDRVTAAVAGLVHQPVHRLVAALGEVLRHALQLAAEHALEARAHLGEGV